MTDKKPTAAEEDYFAREEAEKLHRLHQERLRQETAKQHDDRKALHFMKCSKCGWDLQTIAWRDVEIEKCFHCGVVVLDDGELEKLAGREDPESWVKGVFDLFRAK
jgi:hypothetical protein